MRSRAVTLGLAAGIIAAVIWGGGAVVSRYLVLDKFDPVTLTFLRYAGCIPVAIVVALIAPSSARLDLKWGQTAILFLLAGPAYQVLLIFGYRFATAGAGALLVSGLLPVFAILLGAITGGTAPSFRRLSGALLVVLGFVIFANSTGTGRLSSVIEPTGVIVFVVAAMMWAVLNYVIALWRVSPLSLTVNLAIWSPLFLPLYIAFRPEDGLNAPWHEIMLQILYHGVLVAFVATILFFTAVRLVGSEVAAFLQAAIPAISVLLGAIFLQEWVDSYQAIAIVITVVGIALASAVVRQRDK